MLWWNDKFISTEQVFVIFSSSTIDRDTEVPVAIFWNKEYNVAADGSLDTNKQSNSGEIMQNLQQWANPAVRFFIKKTPLWHLIRHYENIVNGNVFFSVSCDLLSWVKLNASLLLTLTFHMLQNLLIFISWDK